jgi:diacylglycerol kinase (ATP)
MPASKFSSVSVIYNPVSASGLSKQRAIKLAKRLQRRGHTNVQTFPTEYAGHAEKLAFMAANKHQNTLVVSVSGDGGYNEVLNGIMQAKTKNDALKPVCAILAAGNANDHRRSVRKRPLSWAINNAPAEPMDILKLTLITDDSSTVRYAHSYIGLGFTSQAATVLNKESLTRWKELRIVFRTIFHFDPVKIITPSGQKKRYDSLVFANIHQMSKVFRLGKKTGLTSGKFRVIAIAHHSRWRLAFTFLQLLVFGVQQPEQTTSYNFTLDHDNPIQLDGEDLQLKSGVKISVELAPEAIMTLR